MNNKKSTKLIPLIINADDFGVSDGVCKAILELFDMNAISNTTIMLATPGAPQRLHKWGVSNLKGFAGIHLQLTSGAPISAGKDVPSLVDGNGAFLPKDSMINADLKDVETEWNRQIELGIEILGGLPTHLDSHHGAHRIPKFFDLYLSFAQKYNIPVRGAINPELEKKRKKLKILGSSYLIRDWTGKYLGIDVLLKRLFEESTHIKENDIIEVVTHPGYSDNYLTTISALNDAREHDFSILKTMAQESILSKNNIVLISYPNFDSVAKE